jgi:hypothetical protein
VLAHSFYQLWDQLPRQFEQDSNKCIYLYHHAYKQPLSPNIPGNHFCLLREVLDGWEMDELFKKSYKGAIVEPHTSGTNYDNAIVMDDAVMVPNKQVQS